MFEDPVLGGDLAYGYLTHETGGAPSPHFSDWLAYPLSTGYAYTGLAAAPSSMFVQTWPYFLIFTQHLLSGKTLHIPPHHSRRHRLRNRPPQSTAHNHLRNPAAVKARPRSIMLGGSGAVACAETPFTTSTNASGI